jgi:hypothetical protein
VPNHGSASESDRERFAKGFIDLGDKFRRSFEWAKLNFEDVAYFTPRRSPQDLKDFITEENLTVLGGWSPQYIELTRQLATGEKLTRVQLAGVCGYFLVPAAASLTIRAVKEGLLKNPSELWIPLMDSHLHQDNSSQRKLWITLVLPALKKEFASQFSFKAHDPWAAAREHIIVCQLLADVISSSETPPVIDEQLAQQGAPRHLPERQSFILQSMFELKAFDRSSRKTSAEICKHAFGPECNPESYKDAIADLKKRCLIETLPSRGGGCWLTAHGCSEARRNQNEAPSVHDTSSVTRKPGVGRDRSPDA